MEQLYVFGTGNAAVTRCYNTCFAVRTGDSYFMVDAGGGNGILRILKDMDISLFSGFILNIRPEESLQSANVPFLQVIL